MRLRAGNDVPRPGFQKQRSGAVRFSGRAAASVFMGDRRRGSNGGVWNTVLNRDAQTAVMPNGRHGGIGFESFPVNMVSRIQFTWMKANAS